MDWIAFGMCLLGIISFATFLIGIFKLCDHHRFGVAFIVAAVLMASTFVGLFGALLR